MQERWSVQKVQSGLTSAKTDRRSGKTEITHDRYMKVLKRVRGFRDKLYFAFSILLMTLLGLISQQSWRICDLSWKPFKWVSKLLPSMVSFGQLPYFCSSVWYIPVFFAADFVRQSASVVHEAFGKRLTARWRSETGTGVGRLGGLSGYYSRWSYEVWQDPLQRPPVSKTNIISRHKTTDRVVERPERGKGNIYM